LEADNVLDGAMRTCKYARSLLTALTILTPLQLARGEDVIMAPIPEGTEANVQIIGGRPATRSEWPATLLFDSNAGKCTSTIIGSHVVVTAAHCIGERDTSKVLWDNKLTDLRCHVHSDYRGSACDTAFTPPKMVGCTADVAICISAKPLSTEPGKFERVRIAAAPIATHDNINLLGFGCTKANGKLSETLQVGIAKVEWPAQPGASRDPEMTMKEFIKTVGAAVCSGDSGGASYSHDGAKPEMIAVASRGNLSTDSYLVDLRNPQIEDFLRQAQSFTDFDLPAESIKICGMNADADNCR
jgi:hypothetical protein